uniref:Uncharacterized protein n=1 Tax=Romanomermis culicivorax TaxID=13658 RepID=A0A915JSF1_ROMCU
MRSGESHLQELISIISTASLMLYRVKICGNDPFKLGINRLWPGPIGLLLIIKYESLITSLFLQVV